MKATAETLAIISGFISKIGANIEDVLLEVYIGDILELDLEMYNQAGINLLKGKTVGDTLDIVGLKCLLTINEGITIKLACQP